MESSFFDPNGGGDPVMFQHVLWFLGHPEIYLTLIQLVLVIVVLGIVSVRSIRKRAYSKLFLMWLTVAALLSAVWLMVRRAHGQFIEGVGDPGPAQDPASDWALYPPLSSGVPGAPGPDVMPGWSFGVAGPSLLLSAAGLWLMWHYRAALKANVAMGLFLVSAGAIVICGVLLGALMVQQSVDRALHDTYYVVAHFHFTVWIVLSFFVFAAIYGVFRAIAGVKYNRVLALVHWAGWSAGVTLLVAPQFFLSRAGMPRLYAEAEPGADMVSTFSSAGYIVTLISLAVFAICLLEAVYRRVRFGRDIGPKV